MADTEESSCITGLKRSAAFGSGADQPRFTRSNKGLLAVLRIAVRLVTKDFDRSTARATVEHSAKHSNEPLLPGKAAGSEALSVARTVDTCRSAFRESGIVRRAARK